MSIRIFFIAFSIFDESIEKLEAFVEGIESEKLTVFDVDVKTDESAEEKFSTSLARGNFEKSSGCEQIMGKTLKFY